MKVGPETCEDGTPTNGAGCASNCIGPAHGYNCDPLTGNTTTLNTCYIVCGDGFVLSPETCDDGS